MKPANADRLFDVIALAVELVLCCLPVGLLAFMAASAGVEAALTLLGFAVLPAYFAGRFAVSRELERLQRQARAAIEDYSRSGAELRAEPAFERLLESFRVRGSFAFVTLTDAQGFADVLERAARPEIQTFERPEDEEP